MPDGELLGWGWFSPQEGVRLMDATNGPLFMAAVRASDSGMTAYLEDLAEWPSTEDGFSGVGLPGVGGSGIITNTQTKHP
ncbi:hypothetical protein GCM10010324_10430 [Streptomyces hiroshimensis]|uniref:Uncharacterized protein n=1 Tax=Streptomyces hiroshimensis TaxID=66424 RepID=A0ABQ2Y7S9_9ACTN|nr:hypothetical protein GCM10010324_10430 [Streptomyces hiroshimensis]